MDGESQAIIGEASGEGAAAVAAGAGVAGRDEAEGEGEGEGHRRMDHVAVPIEPVIDATTQWECVICTYINPLAVQRCEMCDNRAPHAPGMIRRPSFVLDRPGQ